MFTRNECFREIEEARKTIEPIRRIISKTVITEEEYNQLLNFNFANATSTNYTILFTEEEK